MQEITAHSPTDFICLECERILFDKWIEGCRIHNDPGQEWIQFWINVNSVEYRREWETSICRCCHWCLKKDGTHHYKDDKEVMHFCGMNLLHECKNFKPMEECQDEDNK